MKRFYFLCALISCSLCSLGQFHSDIYLEIPEIDGEVIQRNFEDHIAISAFEQATTGCEPSSSGPGGQACRAIPGAFILQKNLDLSSVKLKEYMFTHRAIPKVTMRYVRSAGPGETLTYYTVTMENVFVTSFKEVNDGDVPREQFTLNVQKVRYSYRPQKHDGTLGSPIEFGWDISTNRAL